MPTRSKLDLSGFEEYLEELVKAGADIDLAADEALAAGADVLVAGMKRRAPFGLIRNAIGRTGIMRDGNKHYVYIGVLRDAGPEVNRIAAVWEFGGRDTPGPGGRKPRPGLEAHPFVRPTFRSDSGKAKAAIEAVFREWLNK